MANHDALFVYIGIYDSLVNAEADYDVVKSLYKGEAVHTYDVALLVKRAGEVSVHKREQPTRRGAWGGLAIGGLLGALFPVGLIAGAAGGAATGGIMGHLRGGVSRTDLEALGEGLDDGDSAVVVVGKDPLAETVEVALSRARSTASRQFEADLDGLQAAVEAAFAEAAEG